MRCSSCVAIVASLSVLACQAPAPQAEGAGDSAAPSGFLYSDLGRHHRAITTTSKDAQRYFDQGLVLAFAFNHDEAIRSFKEATKHDPSCAMAWWGIALANGPHINNPSLDPDHAHAAWEALEIARGFAKTGNDTERALIDALSHRYAADPASDRSPLDAGYADAMRAVWHAHPKDADVGALFAESMMDLRPWDLWTKEKKPQPGTEEIMATLEAVLALDSEHPGANHLYIHTMEASPHPEKALAAADRLRTLVPDAGHLVHMPAHIDLRLGHYAQASQMNERAIEVDTRHRALVPKEGFYHVYMAHNAQFLTYSSMMEGRSRRALEAANMMVAGVPQAFIEQMGPIIDGYMPIALHTFVRFGRWDDVLAVPEFSPGLPISNAMRHYARGVAFAATNRVSESVRERDELAQAIDKVDPHGVVGNSSAHAVLAVAARMLGGEIAFREGKLADSFAMLREAAALEDGLRYDEPPDWMMHARHALGAALLQAHELEDAERVFREDLAIHPENGWALFGLARALELRGATAEAREVKARFDKAWSRADVELKSPCFCQPGI
jgi:tetratricopeptide (TPR) repeat protein